MRSKLEKMIGYLDLIEQSQRYESNIRNSSHYEVFGSKDKQKEELAFQRLITKRLINRLETLKKEL